MIDIDLVPILGQRLTVVGGICCGRLVVGIEMAWGPGACCCGQLMLRAAMPTIALVDDDRNIPSANSDGHIPLQLP